MKKHFVSINKEKSLIFLFLDEDLIVRIHKINLHSNRFIPCINTYFFQFTWNDPLDLVTEDTLPYIAIVGEPYDQPQYGIVTDATRVTNYGTEMGQAVCRLMAVYYVINLQYPRSKVIKQKLNYVYEFIQKILLELDSTKLCARVSTLFEKLA